MKKLALASIVFVIAAPVMAESNTAPVNENYASAGSNASDLLRQGQAAYQQKNYAQAETNWKKAIEIASKDGDNKSKAESMCGLAIVYTKQARVGDAKKASDEAIQFITSTFGESDPRLGLLRKLSEGASSACVAPSVDESGADWMKYMQAGTDAMNSSNYSLAVSNFENALQIVDKTQPDSRVAAATLSPLSAAYLKAGDLKMAELTMRRALPLCKKYFADKPNLIDALQTGLAALKTKQSQK